MHADEQKRKIAIISHCSEVRQDITHAEELLKDAVDKLLEETLVLRSGYDASLLLDGGQAEQTLWLHRLVTEWTNASLLQLQFQDMVTQLLDRAKEGVNLLEVLALKTEAGAQAASESVPISDAEAGERKKSVTSRGMQAGDVDFF